MKEIERVRREIGNVVKRVDALERSKTIAGDPDIEYTRHNLQIVRGLLSACDNIVMCNLMRKPKPVRSKSGDWTMKYTV